MGTWADRFPSFIDAWRRLRLVPVQPSTERPPLDPAHLAVLFDALRAPLATARAAGALLNPWEMARLRRNELRNAAVLSHFLSERLCGVLAVDFLDAILDRVRCQSKDIPSRTQLELGYHVRTEHCVGGDQRDRVDLTIEGRGFVLGIEVKIDASEGTGQLGRYVETIRAWGGRTGKVPAVIFLAPFKPSINVPWVEWHDVALAGQRVAGRARQKLDSHKLLRLFVKHAKHF